MEGPPLGPGGEDITWPDQVAPRGRKASSTRKKKNSNLKPRRPHTPASIVITYPTPNDHTQTWQQLWEDIRGDLLQEHLGLTRTHRTLHLVSGVGQAPHGIHNPGLWAYATPKNPQAAADIKTALGFP